MMTREQMVDRLVSDDMSTILTEGYDDYLYDMLLGGFKGYDNMTIEELTKELNERDIPYDSTRRGYEYGN